MVATLSAVEERIETEYQERMQRLAREASHLQVEQEESGFIVRNPLAPGRIEIVSNAGECTCDRYAVWGRCKHAALIFCHSIVTENESMTA